MPSMRRRRGDELPPERLTALVGHELRVPLAAALLYLAAARRQLEDVPSGGDASRTLLAMGDELQRLDRLISRVVELEERGRPVLRPRLVDLAALVNRTVADTLAVEEHARSSVTIGGDISQQSFPGATNTLRGINNNVFGTTNDFWSGSVSYSYQLARFWNASVTYRYLHRSTTNGSEFLDPLTGLPVSSTVPASANSLLVTVSTTQIVKPLGSD